MYRYVAALGAIASVTAAGPLSKRMVAPNPLLPTTVTAKPVFQDNFPDPSLIQVGKTWYSFATGPGPEGNLAPAIPYATSDDFENWTFNGGNSVLGALGNWTVPSGVWAPDVIELPTGGFVMYYTAQAYNPNTSDKRVYHCVGAATSKNIVGPYEPVAESLACPIDQGGAIDASGFVDPKDGSVWVVYKVDGNNIGPGGNCGNGNGLAGQKPTPIMLQKMKADGVTPDGEPTTILDRDDVDGPLVEAPSLGRKDDTFFLFFSSNCYSSQWYDTSYATSTNGITNGGQKYAKAQYPNAPLLKTGRENLYAPGGLSIAKDGQHVVFHADKGHSADTRQLYAGTVSLDSGKKIATIQIE